MGIPTTGSNFLWRDLHLLRSGLLSADGSAGEPVAGSRCSTPFHAARRKPTLVGYSGHRTLSILSQAYPPSATLYCNSPGRITRVFPTSGAGVLISVSPTRGGFNTPSQSSSFSERFFWFVSSPEATRQRSLSSAFLVLSVRRLGKDRRRDQNGHC